MLSKINGVVHSFIPQNRQEIHSSGTKKAMSQQAEAFIQWGSEEKERVFIAQKIFDSSLSSFGAVGKANVLLTVGFP